MGWEAGDGMGTCTYAAYVGLAGPRALDRAGSGSRGLN